MFLVYLLVVDIAVKFSNFWTLFLFLLLHILENKYFSNLDGSLGFRDMP